MTPKETMELARRIIESGEIPDTHRRTMRLYSTEEQQGRDPRSMIVFDPDKTAHCLYLAIERGAELGIPPLAAVWTMAWFNSKLCLGIDSVMALIVGRPDFGGLDVSYEGTTSQDDWTCTVVITRNGVTFTGTFSWGDAKRAGLTGLPHYQGWGKRMLEVRATIWAARAAYADILKGIGVAEEQRDVEVMAETPKTGAYGISPAMDVLGGIIKANEEISRELDQFTAAEIAARGDIARPDFSMLRNNLEGNDFVGTVKTVTPIQIPLKQSSDGFFRLADDDTILSDKLLGHRRSG